MQTYLQVTLKVKKSNREAAINIYNKYIYFFLDTVSGAVSKSLLLREKDIQVLYGFSNTRKARSYLRSKMFNNHIIGELDPLLESVPEIRIYEATRNKSLLLS